jgi:tRNA/rRNA methyltransferase
MAFWTYILRCSDGSYYTGHTDDLERRIAQHHDGTYLGYTHDLRPVEVVWADEYQTRIEALESERKIKGWSRAKKEALVRGDWEAVQRLARRRKSFETVPQPAAKRQFILSGPPCRQAEGASSPPQDERANIEKSVRGEEALKPKAEAPSRSPSPIIVLVRPQLGENIGKAARAMLNFGLAELRLVSPRDGWPNPSAGPAAAGADIVLEQAVVYETLADAVADCAHVYATTVRKRGVAMPVLTPEAAARAIHADAGRSALVFGPERSGLETEDVALARAIITVPINPEFASLNLAQAVILCAYEWSKGQSLAQPPAEELLPPAPQQELEGMIAQLEAMLTPRNYFFPHSRAEATRLNLRTILTKPGWNHLEVRTLRGVLTTLRRRPDTN